MPVSKEQARRAKEAAKTVLARVPEVAGIGIAKHDDDYVVKVNLRVPSARDIPSHIEGVAVHVEIIGATKKR